MTARFSGLSSSKMRCVFPGLVLPKCDHAGPISPFLFFREQYFQNSRITFGSTVPGKNVAASLVKRIFPATVLPIYFGSTVPGKIKKGNIGLERSPASDIFLFFREQYFQNALTLAGPERILEVLFPEKRRLLKR
jgi:hypothetical protein